MAPKLVNFMLSGVVGVEIVENGAGSIPASCHCAVQRGQITCCRDPWHTHADFLMQIEKENESWDPNPSDASQNCLKRLEEPSNGTSPNPG
jgi:hypothetical protein